MSPRIAFLLSALALFAYACSSPSMPGDGGGGDARTDAHGEQTDGGMDALDVAHMPDAMPDGMTMDAADAQDVAQDAPQDTADAGCTSDAACASDPSGHHVCDVATGRCVECVASNDTCAAGTYCDGTTDRCVSGCRDDSACAPDGGAGDGGGGAAGRCDPDHHVCVQCLGDGDCPAGMLCTGNVCATGCNAGHDCPTGQSCCGGACVDEQANTDHCGACATVCSTANGMSACTAGSCTVGSCTAPFADCDSVATNGCEVNTSNDPNNCGGCGMICPVGPHATATCTSGACGITCDKGFADCDSNPANGCEVELGTDVNHCGACGTTCSYANAAATCTAGVCGMGTCIKGYADCDGDPSNGCEVNTNSDVGHCGACATACAAANGTPVCTAGACAVGTCNTGFTDCDGNPANGCEINTANDANHCGTCTTTCSAPNGTPACSDGACTIGACNAGFADCDRNLANGCEVNTQVDPGNCSACGVVCSTPNAAPACLSGACAIAACMPGFANCDGSVANGCEVNVGTDANNCGGCGVRCSIPNATGTCNAGLCAIAVCSPGFADCDGNPANGCEVNIANDPSHCGSCTNVCSVSNGTPACAGGTCMVGACGAGFTDCNHVAADGCETNTNSNPNNCGGCGHQCVTPNGTPMCASGACGIAACTSGFANCNANPADGCEVNTVVDVNNCGACGNRCTLPNATATCTGGCRVAACLGTYVDTDGNPFNGCECLPDTYARSCTAPTALATLSPGQSTMVSGTIPQIGVSDWFQVTFTGNGNTAFHPRILLSVNPGNLMRFDVATNCTGGLIACGTEGGNSSALTAWEIGYTAGDPNSTGNFSPIPLPGSGGTVWIRVYRSAAAPTAGCGTYTLVASD